MRSLGERYRLCADVIQCEDEDVRKAVLYAVGNTVVCDDLQSARDLCFGSGSSSGNSGMELEVARVGEARSGTRRRSNP